MRFSSVFQLPGPSRLAVERAPAARAEQERVVAVEAAAATSPAPAGSVAAPLTEILDDLDQRVRLSGEW